MQIYLPIAEMSVNIFMLLAMGGVTGILSGMFGVGGGFLMSPLLIFLGVPPAVAVATSANQIIASSVSGFLAHKRRGNVDFKMGVLLLCGGMVGSSLGVMIFRWLYAGGQIDLVISLCYITFLGSVGGLMAIESTYAIFNIPRKPKPVSASAWRGKLPWQLHFPRSKLTISAVLPLAIGVFVGMMVSIMGVGGGFFLIPLMIYVLGMPTSVVIGTSLFQIIFITANVTFLQAISTKTVDIVLAITLLSSAVIGAQIGTKLGAKLPAEKLRGLLALIVLGVAVKLAFGMAATPDDVYSIIKAE